MPELMVALFSYILGAIVIGMIGGILFPRTAIALGGLCVLVCLLLVGWSLVDLYARPPHDTSGSGMLATLSCLSIGPLGLVMLITGMLRR